jgi:hypothetical protein
MIVLNYDSAIQKYLKPGEQVLWVARPRQGWVFLWHNPLIVVQIISAVLIAWWLMGVALWMSGAGGPFPGVRLLGMNVGVVVFVAVTIRQFIRDKRHRDGSWYAVTDQRLLFVLTTVRPESVIGIAYDEIVEVSAQQRVARASPGEGALKLRLLPANGWYQLQLPVRQAELGSNLEQDSHDPGAMLTYSYSRARLCT